MTNRFSFTSEADFLSGASIIAADICQLSMPHALQVSREFWQSSMPQKLSAYFSAKGKTGPAGTISACGPGDVITLDPDDIMGAQQVF